MGLSLWLTLYWEVPITTLRVPPLSVNYAAASVGYLQNYCGAVLLDEGHPNIDVVYGSDNHMFVAIRNPGSSWVC